MESELIAALRRAVDAAPGDVTLRLHLAEQLRLAGDTSGAVAQIAAALQVDPTNATARQAMDAALDEAGPGAEPIADRGGDAPGSDVAPAADVSGDAHGPDFDWSVAEEQVADITGPMFVEHRQDGDTQGNAASDEPEIVPDRGKFQVEPSGLRLDDVGGMASVKDRLNAAFLAPLKNERLRTLYAKSLRGGLLLYGPPGCGKTFIARALAGELGAKFLSIGISDILNPYFGQSEQNLHEAFQLARREAPCVLFFDELDALGARRTGLQASMLRGAVNQLLTELDGVDGANDGVFVLGATNQPWDVDPALKRPGRLDRTVLVLPPDLDAREAIFRVHLRDRPVENIDLRKLAKSSEGLSGADIAFACELAAEHALLDGVRTGEARHMTMSDVESGLAEVRPSIGAWLDSARNVVLFGDDDGTYAELRAYLKKAKRL